MLFGQRPVSMFPSYTYRPEYSQPSFEERYYRQAADEHNRRAEAALRLAQQERERAAREREMEALRERQYQEELARRAHLRQQRGNRRPHSQFFGTPDFGTPLDFFGGAFDGQHPRARAAEERRRRQSQTDDAEGRRFSAFLDHLFQHQEEDAEEEVRVPKKQARFDHNQRPAHPRPQFTRPETKAKSPAPEAPQKEAQEKPAAAERSTPSAEPAVKPAAASPNNHAVSFAALDSIQSQFDALKAAFSFPSNAEFDSSTSASSSVPKLTYASVNAPIHQYENDLVKLLTKLDGVESDGAESIRGARKALVVAVEKELDRLDGQKRDAWKMSLPVQPGSTSANPTESEPADESTSEEQASAEEAQDSSVAEAMEVTETATDYVVAAASVPLPESDDMELEVESEKVEPHPTKAIVEEVSAPIVPETTASDTSAIESTADEVAALAKAEDTSSIPLNIFANTPEALAEDSASETDESEEQGEEAGILVDEDSDSEVEAFIQVEESSPRISEAALKRDVDVEESREDVKLPTPEKVDDEDDFEML